MEEILKLSTDEKIHLGMKTKKILESNKGILAADERPSTLERKFISQGIANTVENRIAFRDCIFSAPEIEKYIGGAILNEETFDQHNSEGVLLIEHLISKNIEIGVKLDKGLTDFGNTEKISVGLEDLENRIREDKFKNATFCKWRSFFNITDKLPTDQCIEKNCIVLCKYALICQKNGRVPILEPEINHDGYYSPEEMYCVAKKIYSTLFLWANRLNLYIPGLILKCSFITEGKRYKPVENQSDLGEINVAAISESIPSAIGGIVYLSGGHSTARSFELLSKVKKCNKFKNLIFSFSFCRALTACALEAWKGKDENLEIVQRRFLETVKECGCANKGIYETN